MIIFIAKIWRNDACKPNCICQYQKEYSLFNIALREMNTCYYHIQQRSNGCGYFCKICHLFIPFLYRRKGSLCSPCCCSGYRPGCLLLTLSRSLDEVRIVEDTSRLLVGEAELVLDVSAGYSSNLSDIFLNLGDVVLMSDLSLSRLVRLHSLMNGLASAFNEEVEVLTSESFVSDGVDASVESNLVSHSFITFPFLYL